MTDADGMADLSRGPQRREPDPSGQAALLLAESTLHVLIEAGVLSRAQGVDAVQTAVEVKDELGAEAGESRGTLRESLRLLQRIEHSLAGGDGAP